LFVQVAEDHVALEIGPQGQAEQLFGGRRRSDPGPWLAEAAARRRPLTLV
jgi:hypothetical protein